jgi:hypothetical protein
MIETANALTFLFNLNNAKGARYVISRSYDKHYETVLGSIEQRHRAALLFAMLSRSALSHSLQDLRWKNKFEQLMEIVPFAAMRPSEGKKYFIEYIIWREKPRECVLDELQQAINRSLMEMDDELIDALNQSRRAYDEENGHCEFTQPNWRQLLYPSTKPKLSWL